MYKESWMVVYCSLRGSTEVKNPLGKEQMYIPLNEDEQYRVKVRNICDERKSSSFT